MAGITAQRGVRSRGSTWVLLAAVLMGTATAVLLVAYVRARDRDREAQSSSTATVVVARRDIPIATTITSDMLEVRRVQPAAAVPAAYQETARVVGLRSRYPIAAGAQVVPGMVIQATTAEALSYIVPPGKRAMAIATSEVISGGGHIRPGDFVDVIVSVEVEKLTGGTPAAGQLKPKGAFTILQNIEVLAVDSDAAQLTEAGPDGRSRDDGNGRLAATRERYRSVTLAVDPAQAQLLFLAETEGKIRLALRPFGDREERPLAPVTEPIVLPSPGPVSR